MSDHGGAGGGDEDGYDMATGTPTHRDVRNWAKAHGELPDALTRYIDQQERQLIEIQQLYEAFQGSGHSPKNPREAAQAIGQMHDAEGEIGDFHKLLLDRTGATQIEPIAIIMGRWLDQLGELERHHREHHNCTACMPCLAHRGPV